MRRKRRGIARFLRMKTILLLNVGILAFVAWGFAGEYVRDRELQEEIRLLQTVSEELERSNLELADMSRRFSGKGQLEREARLKLNLMKPGEQVVVIKDPLSPGIIEAERTEPVPDVRGSEWRMSNIRKWLEYFL